MKQRTFILVLMSAVIVGVAAMWFWLSSSSRILSGVASTVTAASVVSSQVKPPPLPLRRPAPVPESLPDVLPEEGIPSPWRTYAETDHPELAVQESLRVVLKYVLGLELPESARDFGVGKSFRMDIEDAQWLIGKLQEIYERSEVRNGTHSGFLRMVGLSISDNPFRASSQEKNLEPGYVNFTIFLNEGAVLYKYPSKPFQPGDRYHLRLDPKTGCGTYHFEPGVEPD